MADSDKNIVITPNRNQADTPKIVFTGKDSIPITLYVLDTGSLSIEGSSGQLFSVSDDFSGSIFSVNNISGLPSIEVLDTGEIRLAEFGGNIGIGGVTNPQNRLVISGGVNVVGSITSSGEFVGTASWANNAVSSSTAISSSDAVYGFFSQEASISLQAVEAETASYAVYTPVKDVISVDLGGYAWLLTAQATVGYERVIPWDCTIKEAYVLFGNANGTTTIDVKKSNYASYPSFESITSASGMTLVSTNKYRDTTLTDWTASLSAGDILQFNAPTIDANHLSGSVHLIVER